MDRREALDRIRAAAPEEWQQLVVVAVKVALLEALTEATDLGTDSPQIFLCADCVESREPMPVLDRVLLYPDL